MVRKLTTSQLKSLFVHANLKKCQDVPAIIILFTHFLVGGERGTWGHRGYNLEKFEDLPAKIKRFRKKVDDVSAIIKVCVCKS